MKFVNLSISILYSSAEIQKPFLIGQLGPYSKLAWVNRIDGWADKRVLMSTLISCMDTIIREKFCHEQLQNYKYQIHAITYNNVIIHGVKEVFLCWCNGRVIYLNL